MSKRWDADSSEILPSAASKLMSVDGDGKLRHVLPSKLQAFVQGKAFGLIAYNAAAPTPAQTGEYTFSTAGLCSWLTDYPVDKNVVAGDKVLVIYDSVLLTYKYELVKRPDNVASQMFNDSSVEGASVKHALETLDTEKVGKVNGKSLIDDTEITRLAGVTNQTLSGLGGEPAANKKTVINNSDTEFPTSKAVLTGLAGKLPIFTLTEQTEASVEALTVAGRYYITMASGQTLNGVGSFTLDVTEFEAGIEMRQNVGNFTYSHTSGVAGWYVVTGDQALKQDKADVESMAPEVAFNKRVVADGGTVRSKAFMQRVFEANKDLLADTELLFVPEAGAKITDGKIEKLYNLVGTNDAVQATAGSRFYAGNLIADNEKASIKSVEGQTVASLDFADIIYASDSDWTLVINVKVNKEIQVINLGETSYILIQSSGVTVYTGGVAFMSGYCNIVAGENNTITVRYLSGNGQIIVNQTPLITTCSAFEMYIRSTMLDAYNPHYGSINAFCLYNKALSASESQNLNSFLSTEFPAIETIAVGSQQVATSNLEATVFGGTAIPEVTDNAAWAALSTPAWCHYDNSAANGAIYGKLYNGYAVDTINANAPQGFHVPSELEWTQLSEYLGGNTVSGGKLKALYGGLDNALATNESGVSLLPEGQRDIDGNFGYITTHSTTYIAKDGGNNTLMVASVSSSNAALLITYLDKKIGLPIRLFSNTPNLEKLTYDSGWFATDIASSPKAIRIPFGCKVTNIKCITTTSVTAIEAKLFNYAGTELETLITGKACNATTKSFSVTADQSVSYTDNYVRVTAAGNSGTGMIIYVTIEAV